MSNTRYTEIELSVVDKDGNVDKLRPQSKASAIKLNRNLNKMGKNNTSVIPVNVTDVQKLVDALGSAAFKSFEVTTLTNITEPGYIPDARVIKNIEDKITNLIQNGATGEGVIGTIANDVIVTFPADGWVKDLDLGWTNTLTVGESVTKLISDHFTYGLTTNTMGAPSDEEWDAYAKITDLACDKDNFLVIATAPDEHPMIDITIVIKGQGGYYDGSLTSGDTKVLFNLTDWAYSEDADVYINTVDAGTGITDAIDNNFVFGLTTADDEASPSKAEWESYSCITDVAVDKDNGLIIASAKTMPTASIYLIFKNTGNVVGGSSGSSNAAGAAYANVKVSLYASEWVESSDENYTYMNTAYDSKFTSEMNPACSINIGSDHEFDQYEAAWATVKMIVTNNGSITFFSNEIPEIDFEVIVHSIVTASNNTDALEDMMDRMEDTEETVAKITNTMSVMGIIVQVPPTGWTLVEDESSPYDGMFINSVAVTNMTSSFHPLVYLTGKESAGGIPTETEQEAFDTMVTVYTANGAIVFVSPTALTTAINVLVK